MPEPPRPQTPSERLRIIRQEIAIEESKAKPNRAGLDYLRERFRQELISANANERKSSR